ncbi:MAG: phosphatase PAP2 family protein [Minicystis sp.]
MSRLWAHMRRLWPRWTLLPPAPFVLYGMVMLVCGELRWEHVGMILLVTGLAYTNETSKKLCKISYGMGLIGLFYDAMRYVRNVGVSPERVHLCDLRALEIKLFGITMGGERVTVHDWFLTHHWDALDLWCAVPYGTFIFASLGCAVVLYLRDARAVQRFSWAFCLMNVIGFATYHIYPAAPPWYYHAHQCVVDMTANPQAGPRLEHVDALLGFDYFRGMYTRSSDIYGAVPSLHVAYPGMILLNGFRLFKLPGKIFSIVFFVSMCFAAVYLDHHWIIDIVVGLVYCVACWALVGFILARLQKPASASAQTPLLPEPGA